LTFFVNRVKKLHLTFAAVALAAASFFAPSAQAQAPLKIGFTSVEYVLSQMPESKQIESDLKAYGTQLEAQLKAKQTAFSTKLEDYQKKGPSMTPVVKADTEKELQTMQQGLQEFQQTAQQSMQQRQQTALRPVLDKIQKNIDAVANEQGYTYILNSDSGSNPILLHGPKDGDVSDAILKKMGITPTAPTSAPTVQAPKAAAPVVPAAPAGKTKTKTK
jgi:outer membrane protein